MYEDFFGLKDRPFAITPSVDLYFDSTVHRRTLAYLRAGVQQGESLLVMTGEIGAGKTTLLQTLLRDLPAAHVVPATISNTQLDAVGVTESILLAFGTPLAERSLQRLDAALSDRLSRLGAAGQRGLAIVDEAQNLSGEAMRQLLRLAALQPARGARLQVLLSGQPGLRPRVMTAVQEEARQTVCLFCHVGPLGAAETRSYIEHRLKRLGGANAANFSAGAYDEIQRASGGIPRRINRLCDRLLLAAYLAGRRDIDAGTVRQVDADLRQELGDPEASSLGRRDSADVAPEATHAAQDGAKAEVLPETELKGEAEAEVEPAGDKDKDAGSAVDIEIDQDRDQDRDQEREQDKEIAKVEDPAGVGANVVADAEVVDDADVEAGGGIVVDWVPPFEQAASPAPLRAPHAPSEGPAATAADPSARATLAATPAHATGRAMPPRRDAEGPGHHRDAHPAVATPAVARSAAHPEETAGEDPASPSTPPDWGAAENRDEFAPASDRVGSTLPRAGRRSWRALPLVSTIVAILVLGGVAWSTWDHRGSLLGDVRGWWARVVAPSPSVVSATRRDSGELTPPKPERPGTVPATSGRVEQTAPSAARTPASVVPVPRTVERKRAVVPATPSPAQPRAPAPSPTPRQAAAAPGNERPAPAATPTARQGAAPAPAERASPVERETPAPPDQRQAAPTTGESKVTAAPPMERQASAPQAASQASPEPAPQAGRSGPACTEAMVALGLCR